MAPAASTSLIGGFGAGDCFVKLRGIDRVRFRPQFISENLESVRVAGGHHESRASLEKPTGKAGADPSGCPEHEVNQGIIFVR